LRYLICSLLSPGNELPYSNEYFDLWPKLYIGASRSTIWHKGSWTDHVRVWTNSRYLPKHTRDSNYMMAETFYSSEEECASDQIKFSLRNNSNWYATGEWTWQNILDLLDIRLTAELEWIVSSNIVTSHYTRFCKYNRIQTYANNYTIHTNTDFEYWDQFHLDWIFIFHLSFLIVAGSGHSYAYDIWIIHNMLFCAIAQWIFLFYFFGWIYGLHIPSQVRLVPCLEMLWELVSHKHSQTLFRCL